MKNKEQTWSRGTTDSRKRDSEVSLLGPDLWVQLNTPGIVPHKIGAVETTSTTIPAYFLPRLFSSSCNQEGLLRVTNFILCH